MISDEDLNILECSKETFFKHVSKEPLSLSCGHVICKECLPINEYTTIKCSKCGELNQNNLSKSKESSSTKRLFNLSLGNLFGYIEEKLNAELVRFKETSFDVMLDESIDKIRVVIDKRVELLKRELDELKIEFNEKLDRIKEECKKNNNNKKGPYNDEFFGKISTLIEETKQKENQTVDKFYELQERLRELINVSSDLGDTQMEINFKLSDFQLDASYIGEIINITEAKMTQSIQDEFSENNLNQIMSSIFLYKDEIKDLNELCEFSSRSFWKLIYRASTHGYRTQDFHSKCDLNANTLVIIETMENFIFGGFTSQVWSSSGGWKTDSNAFLFSFKNLLDKPFKFTTSKNGKNAIYCHESFGPCFGHGDDITIKDKCNTHEKNESCFPSQGTYFAPSFKQNQYLLAGKRYFQVKDIEVFRIKQYK